MEDFGVSFNRKCTCAQKDCPIRGNCVLCVRNHTDSKGHIPECMQNLIRSEIKQLASMVELSVSEGRHGREFWRDFDKESFVRDALAKHGGAA